MGAFEDSFKNYFGQTSEPDNTSVIANPNDTTYTYKEVPNARSSAQTMTISSKGYETALMRQAADGNIDTIDQLALLLKKILNAAWGSNWGEISPDLKYGEDSKNLILPQITVDINNREVAEKMPIKPVLMDIIKETVDGKETDDSKLIKTQWFDCVVEFDIQENNSKEARERQQKLESLNSIYAGYLKRQGVSEILFLKEVPARLLNFSTQTPMKCLMYFVRFETITPVRQSLIDKINTEIGMKQTNGEKIRQVIEKNQQIQLSDQAAPAEVEFDFFSGDTGVTLDI